MELALASTPVDHSDASSWVIVSQPCDLSDPTSEPYVHVAPVVELGDSDARMATKNWMPRYAPLPARPGSFADLSRILAVPRSALILDTLVPTLYTDSEERAFAAAVARRFSRFAFPAGFNEVISKLRTRLRDKVGKTDMVGVLIDEMICLRVAANPGWSAEVVELQFLIVFHSDFISRRRLRATEVHRVVGEWERLLSPSERFRPVRLTADTADQVTLEDYFNTVEVDLGSVSQAQVIEKTDS